ncbi:uncharacterized protein LOC133817940 [Humulus lupulus]|uniref:uncharacterized protein LOC133817940 n=1 Tax=Humulus lupulus TaxID=3486 RepID=UPI002B408A85|nr:uncharacterized protein LOC133817940 [Humulus lupulus]
MGFFEIMYIYVSVLLVLNFWSWSLDLQDLGGICRNFATFSYSDFACETSLCHSYWWTRRIPFTLVTVNQDLIESWREYHWKKTTNDFVNDDACQDYEKLKADFELQTQQTSAAASNNDG